MIRVAIILGGEEHVWSELFEARALCDASHLEYELLVCNDMIGEYKGDCIGVTLHGPKIEGWINQRRDRRFIPLRSLWFYELHPKVTNVEALKWPGSVGMYATQIALLNLGVQRVMLCGVPMTHGKHFLTKQPWIACDHFWRPWETFSPELLGKVRSFSGCTKTLLEGLPPTVEWLQGVNANITEERVV